MTTPHPHKDILIAIANGLPISEIEVRHEAWATDSWAKFENWTQHIFLSPNSWVIRIKQKTVMFNGVELPEPIKETPENGKLLYLASPEYLYKYNEFYWAGREYEQRSLKRGLIHKTKEAALAWADALTPFKD